MRITLDKVHKLSRTIINFHSPSLYIHCTNNKKFQSSIIMYAHLLNFILLFETCMLFHVCLKFVSVSFVYFCSSIFSELKYIFQGMRVLFTQSTKRIGKFGWYICRRHTEISTKEVCSELNSILMNANNFVIIMINFYSTRWNWNLEIVHMTWLINFNFKWNRHTGWKQCSEHVKNVDLFYSLDKDSLRIISVIIYWFSSTAEKMEIVLKLNSTF